MELAAKDIFLKKLKPEDVTDAYVGWMNDKDVTRFLECRWTNFTRESIKEFVGSMNSGDANCMFGIFLKNGNRHIGNIKIGNINKKHKFADIGLLIGDKTMWGKGYATAAIGLATDYAFKELKLNKVTAGIYADNVGSYNAFMKNSYREVGRLKNHRAYEGGYMDDIIVERCNPLR